MKVEISLFSQCLHLADREIIPLNSSTHWGRGGGCGEGGGMRVEGGGGQLWKAMMIDGKGGGGG